MDVKFITSTRGKTMLVVNSYKYSFQKELKISGETLWKCANRKCKATAHSLGSYDKNIIINKINPEHCHEPNEAALNRQILSEACKRKATDDLAEKPSKIIRQELQADLPSTINKTDIEYIRKNVYNARRKVIPSLPRNISEVHLIISELNLTTNKNEPFVLINSEIDNIIVFSCGTNVRTAGASNHLYLDGTFDYCTQFFCQLFTIHGFINGHYIPLFFVYYQTKQQKHIKNFLF